MVGRCVGIVGALVLVGGVLAVPGIARAAQVSVVDGTAVFEAAPNESNDVHAGTIAAPDDRTLKIIDTTAALNAGAGCQQIDAHSVWCPEGAPGLALELRLGDEDDQAKVDDFSERSVTILAGAGDDVATVGSGIGSSPVIDGGAGNDRLTGNNNANGTPVMFGRLGNDVLTINEAGGGHLYGGRGNDRLNEYSRSALFGLGDVRLRGGRGDDTYAFFDATVLPETMAPSTGTDTLYGDVLVFGRPRVFDVSLCQECVERVIGSSTDDRIFGDDAGQTIRAGDGDDDITGGGGRDAIAGENGNDTVNSRDGKADDVSCGPGTDTVSADRRDGVSVDCESVTRAG